MPSHGASRVPHACLGQTSVTLRAMRSQWLLSLVLVGGVARAEPSCPAAVKNAIDKAFPKATIAACKAGKDHGHAQFEVKIAKADGNQAGADVAPARQILQVAER